MNNSDIISIINYYYSYILIERTHLKILKELERQGSLTSAAQSLHLTQSALSHTIRKLENLAGVSIWEKKGRNIQLTQAGQYLLKAANRLLPQLERIDETLTQFAEGDRGTLKIGMECHPCYQWLLTVIRKFLDQWPGIDVDVKQKFKFGGMAALFNHEIDLLVTPDPLQKKDIIFTPVFDYEQVLVISTDHKFNSKQFIKPEDLQDQTLYTYPVEKERLDIFKMFLLPANCSPKSHKTIEATEIMIQLVAANRCVATLPKWLVEQYANQLPITSVRLGSEGINKQIHLGVRVSERPDSCVLDMIKLAKEHTELKKDMPVF